MTDEVHEQEQRGEDIFDGYPPLMTVDQVAECGVKSVNSLNTDRSLGVGLPFVKFGRVVRYRKCDIQAYVDAHLVRSTAEAKQVAA